MRQFLGEVLLGAAASTISLLRGIDAPQKTAMCISIVFFSIFLSVVHNHKELAPYTSRHYPEDNHRHLFLFHPIHINMLLLLENHLLFQNAIPYHYQQHSNQSYTYILGIVVLLHFVVSFLHFRRAHERGIVFVRKSAALARQARRPQQAARPTVMSGICAVRSIMFLFYRLDSSFFSLFILSNAFSAAWEPLKT